jgi:predicted RNA-binding protein with PIN domain
MAERYYIDGYNVLHKSSMLKSLVVHDLETAREAMIDKIGHYCAATGHEVTIVFDGRGLHKAEHQPHHRGVASLRILYAPGHLTADTVIEREVYKDPNRRGIVVVSNDFGLRSLCSGMGALTMGVDNFLQTVRETRGETNVRLESAKRNARIERLEDRLDEGGMARLKELREKLGGNSEV